MTYTFQNTGFGIPNDLFQKYLYGDASLASEELKTLREGIRWVEAWGGEPKTRELMRRFWMTASSSMFETKTSMFQRADGLSQMSLTSVL